MGIRESIATVAAQLDQNRDPFSSKPKNPVIRAKVKYRRDGHPYVYVFLRAGGAWYGTGNSVYAGSWQDVLDFLSSRDVVSLEAASEWETAI